MHEAMLYRQLPGNRVACGLCAHGCQIDDGGRGVCQVRENRAGALYSLVYGRPIAANLDPIEKKPLFHFLPGTLSFSIATVGCNFQCGFCQNWNISQMAREGGRIPGGDRKGNQAPARQIVDQALASGAASISYTYTEPTIYFEYAHDCMKLAVEVGLKNVFVSNGYQSAACVEACRGLLHAANIDLKAMSDGFYRKHCKARLRPVLDSLVNFRRAGVFLEITTLLIPGENDDPAELADLAGFIAAELGEGTPWHVSRFHPDYKVNHIGPTPVSGLEKALEIGREAGLHFVYAGNIPGHDSESTKCPGCGGVAVSRQGYMVKESRLKNGACPDCGREIPGVWR